MSWPVVFFFLGIKTEFNPGEGCIHMKQRFGSPAEGKVSAGEDQGPNSDLTPQGCVPKAQSFSPVMD